MNRPKTAVERAVEEHMKDVWELLRRGREIAAVHQLGHDAADRQLPAWDSLDESSQFAFGVLAMAPLKQLIMLADAITAELGHEPPGGL